MTDVVVPTAPALARIANVELMHTGTWPISTGVFTFTTDDLVNAVAALDCPAVRRPILKLGHTDPRFDGEPAVGYIDNLAVADNGYTLVGDYAGMPGWLGDVIASAYPDRSIEGEYDFHCQMGHTHPFVLTGLALLGVTAPGIGTLESLQDIAQLYGVDVAASAAQQSGGGTPVTVTASQEGGTMPNPAPAKVAASVTTEDIRRKFYAENPSWDIWVEEIQVDPALQCIVMNDATGDRTRVPVVIGDGEGDDAVSFGDPVKVVIRYDDAAVAAAAGGRPPVRYASKAESRPAATQTPPAEPVDSNTPNPTQEVIVADASSTTLSEGLRQRLGITDADADEATLLAAVDEALAERTSDDPIEPAVPTVPVLPEGVSVIDTAALEELQIAARAGQQARVRQLTEDRDASIRAAISDGRIPGSRREHWEKQFAADSEGAAKMLASLAPGTIPVEASGLAGDSDALSQEDADLRALGFAGAVQGANV
jgi:hypothetical protein